MSPVKKSFWEHPALRLIAPIVISIVITTAGWLYAAGGVMEKNKMQHEFFIDNISKINNKCEEQREKYQTILQKLTKIETDLEWVKKEIQSNTRKE